MKFIFADLYENEADIIANFLTQDNILFKTYQRKVPIYIDCEDDEPYDFINIYDIICNTTLEYFDFVKNITNKQIKTIRDLNRIYYTKIAKKGKKRVSIRKKTSD